MRKTLIEFALHPKLLPVLIDQVENNNYHTKIRDLPIQFRNIVNEFSTHELAFNTAIRLIESRVMRCSIFDDSERTVQRQTMVDFSQNPDAFKAAAKLVEAKKLPVETLTSPDRTYGNIRRNISAIVEQCPERLKEFSASVVKGLSEDGVRQALSRLARYHEQIPEISVIQLATMSAREFHQAIADGIDGDVKSTGSAKTAKLSGRSRAA